jgi:arginine decarboxylase
MKRESGAGLQSWSIGMARELYRVAAWSEGYFDVDDAGRAVARPRPGGPGIPLPEVADAVLGAGLRLPVLVRFTDILADRVRGLCAAFDEARARHDFAGGYTAVYPVKVNQQRTVVEHIVRAGGERVGLEAGSKPELMAVLALAPAGCTIVCNGYKDRAFVRLALIGQRLGHPVYLVVEKPSELDDIVALAEELGLRPLIGLRVRLAGVAAGHWQNTGGDKSKFGLTASQAVAAVERLRSAGCLDGLRMLHVHVGSQVADRAALDRAMAETAALYRGLRQSGAPLDCVDVGGGLAVDYEGRGDVGYCSMNYRVADYADLVVSALAEVCRAHDLPHPHVISESGRALTAHHAVLLTEVIDSESPEDGTAAAIPDGAPLTGVNAVQARLDEVRSAFVRGELELAERAEVERECYAALRALAPRLDPEDAEQRAVLDALREKLADKYFCNFSVFQSLPDVWALDQIFPILPLARLDERPDRRVRLCDLTCDSDGRIDRYVDADGLDTTLPLHALRDGEPYRLGIFMVGAYQENLGDMHNLFGDTDAVNVEMDGDRWRLAEPERGDGADELLRYVHFEPDALRAAYRDKLAAAELDADARADCLGLLEEGLSGYTYLLD